MVCLKNFLRTQHHYFIPIRVGNTSTQNTGDCYLNTTLLKACPEEETVWITELWKTSSADLKLKCSMVKNLKVLTLSLRNLKNTFINIVHDPVSWFSAMISTPFHWQMIFFAEYFSQPHVSTVFYGTDIPILCVLNCAIEDILSAFIGAWSPLYQIKCPFASVFVYPQCGRLVTSFGCFSSA